MRKLAIVVSFLMFYSLGFTENSKTENGYEVHYNALSSSFLSPEIAKNYHIPRSKTRGFINIAVLKLNGDKLSTPVEAMIKVDARNFYGQKKSVELKKIAENDGAIYYISTFPVSSRESIKFKLEVVPQGSTKAIEISFDQEFFTD